MKCIGICSHPVQFLGFRMAAMNMLLQSGGQLNMSMQKGSAACEHLSYWACGPLLGAAQPDTPPALGALRCMLSPHAVHAARCRAGSAQASGASRPAGIQDGP